MGVFFCLGGYAAPMARSAMQKAARSVVSEIGRPRTGAGGVGKFSTIFEGVVE